MHCFFSIHKRDILELDKLYHINSFRHICTWFLVIERNTCIQNIHKIYRFFEWNTRSLFKWIELWLLFLWRVVEFKELTPPHRKIIWFFLEGGGGMHFQVKQMLKIHMFIWFTRKDLYVEFPPGVCWTLNYKVVFVINIYS